MTEVEQELRSGVPVKPIVIESDVVEILSETYGLKCVSIKQLNGYDDNNYHVKVQRDHNNKYVAQVNEHGYVLKIINSLDSLKPEIFEAQHELLTHLHNHGICCPKPVLTKNGLNNVTRIFPSGTHIVRLLEFIAASILCQVPSNKNLFSQCGKYVAKLDDALKSFHHHVYDTHKTVWMLESLPELAQFLFVITDNSKKKVVEEVIDDFCNRVIPEIPRLEKGMIHGDFNEQNVLVEKINDEWQVKGVIDFGDCHFSCYLFEIAITMTYIILQSKNLESGSYVLEGYNSVKKITELEYSLLKTCIAARLCQSLVLGAYSYSQNPSNSYILTTAKYGWDLLEELWSKPGKELLERWNNANNKNIS